MNIALILSGGTGTRLGADTPKQYIEVCGKPIISYNLERLSDHDLIDTIHITAAPIWQGHIKQWLSLSDPNHKFKGFGDQGKNRQLSIYNGLEAIKSYASENDNIHIHPRRGAPSAVIKANLRLSIRS